MASSPTAGRSGDGSLHPLALRPLGTFPPRRLSVFEDPGDERSWHVSQTFASLMRFYEGREPAWYASAVRELTGCASVLELGCGPGLALRALRDAGVSRVLGLDRWPGFAETAAAHDVPVLMHDLSLPMPFVPSASVEGVFSHYVLDYMSPVGVRQALREARRVLAPDGRLVVLLAAIGLGGRDAARTVRFTPEVMEQIAAEAGFTAIHAHTPTGRNTVLTARAPEARVASESTTLAVAGEVQLSAGYLEPPPGLSVELSGDGWRLEHELGPRRTFPSADLPPGLAAAAVTARLERVGAEVWELQVWAWRHGIPVAADAVRLPGRPRTLALRGAGGVPDHVSAWAPKPAAIGAPAAIRVGGQPRPGLNVTSAPAADGGELEMLTALDLRGVRALGDEALDRDWREGRVHAVVLEADRLGGADSAVLWAIARGAPVLLDAPTWADGLAMARGIVAYTRPPLVVLDPAASGRAPDASAFSSALTDAARLPGVHLAPAPPTLAGRSLDPFAPVVALLRGDEEAAPPDAAQENLRYLCERALLLRLRATSGRGRVELGRRPPLEEPPAGML